MAEPVTDTQPPGGTGADDPAPRVGNPGQPDGSGGFSGVPLADRKGDRHEPGGPADPGGGHDPGDQAGPNAAGGRDTNGAGGLGGLPPQEAPAAGGTLLRTGRHKVVAGVCGGLGRYFDIDPIIFRVVLTVLALTGGIGLLAYGLGWLLIPAEDESHNELHRLLSGRADGAALTAVLTAIAGCGLFLATLGSDGGPPFPLFVIGALLIAVYWSQRRRGTEAPPWAPHATNGPVADAPPAAQPPPTLNATVWWKDKAAEGTAAGRYLWGPDDDDEAPMEPVQPREPRSLMGLTLFGAAVVAGVGGAALTWSKPLGTALQTGFACALAVLGVGLLVASLWGRARAGTVVWALLTAVLLIASAALPKSVDNHWRHRVSHAAFPEQIHSPYTLGTGYQELDLSRFDPRGRDVAVTARLGAGQLRVTVPADIEVRVRAHSGLGVIQLHDVDRGDVDVSVNARRTSVLHPTVPRAERREGVLRLRLDVGIGRLVVTR